ncbi:MAG: hypothetical protein HZB66_00500 [Candidatus Aenigmarchaeota archaeon]|nr:hypothetical protein [Candidatus Aenigmarchaeota archaeon]
MKKKEEIKEEKEADSKEEKKEEIKEEKKYNMWKIAAIVMIMLFVASILTTGFTAFVTAGSLSGEQAAKKAVDYINTNLLQGQATAKAVSIAESNGMYNVKLDIGGVEYNSFITKDGSLLFPNVVDLNKPVPSATPEQPTKTCEDIKKTDKPVLQAFVVSYCPYGLQMQRALVSVAEIMGDNIKIRYIGSVENGKVTSMHGETEAAENLRQICIREEQKDKYWAYVKCFIKEGKADECLTETKVDKTKLKSCIEDPTKGVKYAEQDFLLQDQYQVSGSPTLILDGETVSEFDFGGRSPEALKTLICCAFKEKPAACSTTLSTAQVSTGLTTTESGTTGAGQC